MSLRYDALMMIGFGGPTRREEVRPFLNNVLRGRPVPQARYDEVAGHYEMIGGSPYNELTMRQAEALRSQLRREGLRLPVHVGMRNWAPYLSDAMTAVAQAGAQRVLGFVLAPHRCEASWERYQQSVESARETYGPGAPAFDYPGPWHNHPLFIDAVAARVSAAMEDLSAAERASAQLVFTAHSIPDAMARASSYVSQLTESARLVAGALSHRTWSIAYQSRSGDARDAWLEPDIGSALRSLSGRTVVVVPIGFVCDHVEVLYDLDIEAAAVARGEGIRMVRAGTVGNHPRFIEMIAAVVRRHIEE